MKSTVMLLLLFYASHSLAQIAEKELSVGKSLLIESEIFGDQREIQIYLPENYVESANDYPVLYILDGQRYFLHGISLQQSFLNFKQTSEFIIVGISQKRSDRNRMYLQDSEKYLLFIENEVIRIVDRKFRTSKDRMIFGWAFGGGFVIQALISKPNLFDAYIAASPFPLEDKINSLDSLLLENSIVNKILFFASETNEGAVKRGTYCLDSLLTNKAPNELNWTFKKLEGEEHRSTAYSTLYHGIQKFYQYFAELQFNSLEEFRREGGLPYVHNYYKRRSEKFGFQARLTDWTMFSLTRNAIRENDLEQFEIFINEFIDSEFLGRISINRAISVANFYADNHKYHQAIKIFKILAKKHPNSDQPLIGLGDTYKAMNDGDKALLFYKKAREMN